MTRRTSATWTFLITAGALHGQPRQPRRDHGPARHPARLGASLGDLEWTVNAYTLTFAVLLLTGAALGDRFGRRRMFVIGLAHLHRRVRGRRARALDRTALIAARAVQGIGGAIIMPLTLTILSAAVPPQRRRPLALGAWGAIAGLAVAVGPVVGGAIVAGRSWQWIFWINVPIGIVARRRSRCSASRRAAGRAARWTCPASPWPAPGCSGIVCGVTHGNGRGWTDPQVLASIGVGAPSSAGFVAWELRAAEPMLPLRLFRRGLRRGERASLFLMSFGMFGSIFLLSQFFQVVQGLDRSRRACGSCRGPRCRCSWRRSPGSPRPGSGAALILAAGLGLQAARARLDRRDQLDDRALHDAGAGVRRQRRRHGAVLRAGRQRRPLGRAARGEGKASGANNTIRELGGVFGVAVLAAIFAANGCYAAPRLYVDGLTPAVAGGSAVVALAALVALALPGLVAGLQGAGTVPAQVRVEVEGSELAA